MNGTELIPLYFIQALHLQRQIILKAKIVQTKLLHYQFVLPVCRKEKQLPFSVTLFKVKKKIKVGAEKKKFFWQTLKEPPFSTPTSYFELRSLELHYRLGFNKKTLVGDALNDQRLPRRKIVEKWPIYFLPPLGCLNGFLFPPVRQLAHCSWAATRGQSECGEERRALAAGKQPCCERDKEGGPFTQLGLQSAQQYFSEGHQGACGGKYGAGQKEDNRKATIDLFPGCKNATRRASDSGSNSAAHLKESVWICSAVSERFGSRETL